MKAYRDKTSWKKVLFVFIGLLLFIIVWEMIAFATDQRFLPEFFACLGTMFELLGEFSTWSALGHTILYLVISLICSMIFGIILGTLGGYYPHVGEVLSPIITIMRAFPTIALVLLLVVFVPNFSIYVCGMVLFPIIYQATYEGTRSIYERFGNQIRIDGKNHLNVITRVVLPLNLSHILLGAVQAFGLGIKIEVMAETFAYSVNSKGIGNYIQVCYQNVDYSTMMSYVLICIFLALIVDLIIYFVKKKMIKE